uniref:hypothetical protein n=1 Tax=Salmonella enterica TaxID=28901 RepID=UPI001C38CB8A
DSIITPPDGILSSRTDIVSLAAAIIFGHPIVKKNRTHSLARECLLVNTPNAFQVANIEYVL